MTTQRIGRLDVTIHGPHLVLAGRIDEASPIGDLAAQLPAGGVAIDTAGVTFVNSIGMRELMRLVRALRDRGPIALDRVADVLITQLNLLPELGKSVTVRSFHAQYVCPSCGAEPVPLLDAVAYAADLRRLVAPKLPCPECGAAMDLGDFPEKYLSVFKG
jgi:predicted RNA-binding Zn-ribbon protein involved in translation (DUF1610 family)